MADREERWIWTVGHGRQATDELTGVLRSHAIDEVVDIRRFPSSRRNPQFSHERLVLDLPAAGIGYRWSGDTLGGRRRLDPAGPPQDLWREASFRAFAQHLRTPEARSAVALLGARARARERLVVMCSETLWWRCHRRLVADALELSGIGVLHLVGTMVPTRHPLSPGARLDARGLILYEAATSRAVERPPL
jgi:uncharacterized protein (DUF488 family)